MINVVYSQSVVYSCCRHKVDVYAVVVQRLKGVLAQLAGAFDWQSRGHRFDSDILHDDYQRVIGRCSINFFFLQAICGSMLNIVGN